MKSLAWWLAALAVAGCGTPEQGNKADTQGGGASDAVVFDVPKGDGGDSGSGDASAKDQVGGDQGAADGQAGGSLTLTFEVDDSANKTFGDGEIVWTGSFSWDQATNSITYATSWLPSDGPYPPLYDDGPISTGGHEREGATKGDHVFSTQVKFTATEATTLEYGALNELGNWMWNGANGTLQIAKGQQGVVQVPGMKLTKHGTLDLKVALDTKKLAACCTKWSLTTHALYLKGSMNMWTAIQLLDDGKKGDDTAGDGILTYVHKQNLGKHDGGLNAGEEAQFIFVSTQGDTLPDAGQEYKGAKEAFADGVSAWTATGPGGSWETAPVVLAKDSKGKFLNTAVKIPDAKAGTPCVPECLDSQFCDNGVCKPSVTGCTPPCSGNTVCKDNKCEPVVAALQLDSVDPSKGAIAGGTVVTLLGSGFAVDAKVSFGGAAAKDIVVSAGGTEIQCSTPAHAEGTVDVEVANPGGSKVSIKQGFVYQAPPKPAVLLLASFLPAEGLVAEGSSLALVASVTIAGVTGTPGVTPDLDVWIGTAKVGSAPTDDAAWTWAKATYDGEATGESWAATVPAPAKGNWLVGAKAVWQDQKAFAPTSTISVVDPKTLPSKLTGVSPTYAAAKGGASVILQGVNLPADASVVLIAANGTKASATNAALLAGGLQVTVPALPIGPVDIQVTPPGKAPLLLPAALFIIPQASPTVDGDMADQPAAHLLATTAVVSDWGVGKNELKSMWVSYDAQNLTIAVQGQTEASNAITVYLDVDYEGGTGVQSPIDLKDNSGAVDDALATGLKLSDPKLGLDFGMATLGMASFAGADLGQSTSAGWRSFADVSNFSWLAGVIAAKAGKGFEASIPLKVLYPNGIPASGAKLRVFVTLGNKDGAASSNQYLPEQGSTTVTVAVPVVAIN